EARDAGARRHVDLLQHLAGGGIDLAQVARVALPGGVPELAVDPGHAGDEAAARDGAQDRAGTWIDLVDLLLAVDADPERAFRPGEPGVAAAARRRNGRDHLAGVWIDLLNAALGDLKQMLAVERGSGVRGDVERALGLAALRIDRIQLVVGGEPDMLAV